MKKICMLSFILVISIFLVWKMQKKVFATNQLKQNITYSIHLQDVGWENDFIHKNGEIAGFIDKDLKIEAIKIKIDDLPKDSFLTYQVHVENLGWMNYVENGIVARNNRKKSEN